MMAITFNGFNARTSHINPFEGIGRNKKLPLGYGINIHITVCICYVRRKCFERRAALPLRMADMYVYGVSHHSY